jgi:hypothetical protein
MPDGGSLPEIKISELPVATQANATDQIEANQAGNTRSITINQVSTAVANSGQMAGLYLPLAGGTLTGPLNGTISNWSGKQTVTAADAAQAALFRGVSKGVRFVAGPTEYAIEGVDNTGNASYQPIRISGTEVRFGVSAETMRLDATGLGIGIMPALTKLHIRGAGQAAAAVSTSTGLGATAYLQDSGAAVNNGGMLMFGASQGAFAALKGLVGNGSSNTTGDLVVSTRRIITDATLTETARFGFNGSTTLSGRLGVGMTPSGTATSTVWATGDITLNGANHLLGGNLYFDSGWKYTAGGATGAAVKLGIDTATAYQLLVAPNNTGAAGAAAVPVAAMNVDGAGAVTFPNQVTFNGTTAMGGALIGYGTLVNYQTNGGNTQTPLAQIASGGQSSLSIQRYANAVTNGPILNFSKSQNAAAGGQTVAINNDILGVLSFNGSDGTKFVEGAYIRAEVDGTPGTNDMPTRLIFAVAPDGTSIPVEAMRINNLGQTLFGYGTGVPFSSLGGTSNITPMQQIASTGIPSLSLQRYSAAGNPSVINFSKSAGAALGTQTVVGATDFLGALSFNGSDGVKFVEGAYIRAEVDGTPGLNDMPTRIVFSVTPDGSATPAEAFRISNNKAALFSSTVGLKGATSGTSTVQAPAVAGATTITLPSATGTLALLDSPAFINSPTAPTVTPATDNTTKVATTAFVQSAITAAVPSAQVGHVTATGGLYAQNLAVDTVIPFGTVVSGNTGAWWSTSTNRYTPPAGRYFIQATVGTQAPAGGNGTWTLKPRKNGTVIGGIAISASGAAGFAIPITVGLYVDANGTDFFDWVAAQGAAAMNAQGGLFTAYPV